MRPTIVPSPKPSCSLLSLSDDLLSVLLRAVLISQIDRSHPTTAFQDFRSLSLVCKRFHNVYNNLLIEHASSFSVLIPSITHSITHSITCPHCQQTSSFPQALPLIRLCPPFARNIDLPIHPCCPSSLSTHLSALSAHVPAVRHVEFGDHPQATLATHNSLSRLQNVDMLIVDAPSHVFLTRLPHLPPRLRVLGLYSVHRSRQSALLAALPHITHRLVMFELSFANSSHHLPNHHLHHQTSSTSCRYFEYRVMKRGPKPIIPDHSVLPLHAEAIIRSLASTLSFLVVNLDHYTSSCSHCADYNPNHHHHLQQLLHGTVFVHVEADESFVDLTYHARPALRQDERAIFRCDQITALYPQPLRDRPVTSLNPRLNRTAASGSAFFDTCEVITASVASVVGWDDEDVPRVANWSSLKKMEVRPLQQDGLPAEERQWNASRMLLNATQALQAVNFELDCVAVRPGLGESIGWGVGEDDEDDEGDEGDDEEEREEERSVANVWMGSRSMGRGKSGNADLEDLGEVVGLLKKIKVVSINAELLDTVTGSETWMNILLQAHGLHVCDIGNLRGSRVASLAIGLTRVLERCCEMVEEEDCNSGLGAQGLMEVVMHDGNCNDHGGTAGVSWDSEDAEKHDRLDGKDPRDGESESDADMDEEERRRSRRPVWKKGHRVAVRAALRAAQALKVVRPRARLRSLLRLLASWKREADAYCLDM